jgi:tRNA(fMet)-specific endonuclease VapC
MILDSTFINDLVRGRTDADNKLDELIDSKTPIAMSSLTVFEVGIGLRGEAKKHQQRFDTTVNRIEVVPLGVAESRSAVSIQHDLLNRGEKIGEVDVLIAGTAVERGEDVLTRNVDEFARVDDLAVETY